MEDQSKNKIDESAEDLNAGDKNSQQQEADPTKIHIEKNPRLLISGTIGFIKSILSFRQDVHDPEEIYATTKSGIVFKGSTVWILICSIMIASVGLNMNSTAVIVGAMLISPLMGPIRGIGYAVGISDLALLKESLKNFGITVAISIIVAYLYFSITPIKGITSELGGRIAPSFLDTIIAFAGGLAGAIALVKGENDTIVPGVAIATALMPPLCTAGYGLAIHNWTYFIGASYLFLLNSLLIALTTMILVRYLKFPKKDYLSPQIESKVRNYIIVFMVLIIAPSGYLFYRMSQRTIFESNAESFVEEVVQSYSDNIIVFPNYEFDAGESKIHLNISNAYIDSLTVNSWEKQKGNYSLDKTELIISQGEDFEALWERKSVELDNQNGDDQLMLSMLNSRDRELKLLKKRIDDFKNNPVTKKDPLDINFILQGFKIDYPELNEINVNRGFVLNNQGKMDTTYNLSIRFKSDTPEENQQAIRHKISQKMLLEINNKTTTAQDSVIVNLL